MWQFICAVVTRALFILVSLIGVYRVTRVKNDSNYWFLTLLFLPLVQEMIITLKRRKGKDYKWYSPAILLFLISIIPSIWILELHHQHSTASEQECSKPETWEELRQSFSLQNGTSVNISSFQTLTSRLDHLQSSVCSRQWNLTLHMVLLVLLILGKWILPIGGGVTKDELSQLLLIFVGTAADILEFTSETPVVGTQMIYVILFVWTWSMLQFPLHLSVVNSSPEDEGSRRASLLSQRSTDLWTIVQALFIQDGPFLVVRLVVLLHFTVFDQMLVFFAVKNSLVVLLNVYRLALLCRGAREPGAGSEEV